MKRLCMLATTVAILVGGDFAEAQQRGGEEKSAHAQEAGQDRGRQDGGGGKRGGGQGGRRGGGQGGGGLFALLDVDRDGKLSAKEIDGAVAALMKLDVNKDGVLDAQELIVKGGDGKRKGGQNKGGQNKGGRNQSAGEDQ